MATKSMGYDNPAYLAVHQDNVGPVGAGANAASQKCVAFANAILKSVTMRPTTAGTAADIAYLFQASGTTTTTTTLGTNSAALSTASFNNFVPSPQPVLAAGDQYWVQKGADTVAIYACAIERVVQPLANVTQ